PEFQGAGLGTALQACLQEYAMSRNVRGFVFEILPRNTSMLRLAARTQGTVTTSRDDEMVHVSLIPAVVHRCRILKMHKPVNLQLKQSPVESNYGKQKNSAGRRI